MAYFWLSQLCHNNCNAFNGLNGLNWAWVGLEGAEWVWVRIASILIFLVTKLTKDTKPNLLTIPLYIKHHRQSRLGLNRPTLPIFLYVRWKMEQQCPESVGMFSADKIPKWTCTIFDRLCGIEGMQIAPEQTHSYRSYRAIANGMAVDWTYCLFALKAMRFCAIYWFRNCLV